MSLGARYHSRMSVPTPVFKPRILIAEDESGIADTLQYVLKSDGAHVRGQPQQPLGRQLPRPGLPGRRGHHGQAGAGARVGRLFLGWRPLNPNLRSLVYLADEATTAKQAQAHAQGVLSKGATPHP